MTTFLPLYSLHDIFCSKFLCNSARFCVKYSSGSMKLIKPGPAISAFIFVGSGSLATKASATSRGFLCKMLASFMATLVAKSARKSPVASSSGAGVTSTVKFSGTSKRVFTICSRVDLISSIGDIIANKREIVNCNAL